MGAVISRIFLLLGSMMAACASAAVPSEFNALQSRGNAIKTCRLGGASRHAITVYRGHAIAGSYVYTFRYAGKPGFFYDSAEASRGLGVRVACVGKQRRALVVFGEFSSNFVQGFVAVRNPKTGQLERLDFAERSPPQWLYLGEHESMAIMPTHGRGEYGGSKYVVYRRKHGSGGDAEASGADMLPLSRRYEIARVGG